MPGGFRLTMAQLDPTLGDIAGNRAKALAAHGAGIAAGADFVALPELFLTGYQPQDLALKPAFVAHAMAEAEALAAEIAGRGAKVFLSGRSDAPGVVSLPSTPAHPLLEPILLIQSFYGLAARLSVMRGFDPDRPRYLNKVTETV